MAEDFRTPHSYKLTNNPPGVRTAPISTRKEKPKDRIEEKTISITQSAGPLTADEARQWTKAQIAYKNYATDKDVAQRAINYCKDIRQKTSDRMHPLHLRWRWLTHLLRGNNIDSYGVEAAHIPELYKAMEALVPRVEEAVTQYDPNFRVKGRDKKDRLEAQKIQRHLEWQLSQMGMDDKHQPLIRSMFNYQVCVLKARWERTIDERVHKEVDVTIDEKTGLERFTISRTFKEEVVYDGPAASPVDPYDLIVDLDSTDSDEYIGDQSFQEEETLRRLYDLGQIDNFKAMEGQTPTVHHEGGDLQQDHKRARSVTERVHSGTDRPDGSPVKWNVVEIWTRFDLYGNGRPVECRLVVADDKYCLVAMENPNDDKIRPYAIARCAKEGFEFFNTGPFDQALRLSTQLDHHWSLFLEANKLGTCPIVITDDQADLPESIYGVLPGSVFHASRVDFTSAPNTLQAAPWIDERLRTDIQRAIGAPEIFEGTGDVGTATEFSGKLAEGNRRVRGYVRSYSKMLTQLLRIMHSMNGQFVIGKVKHRVLGKDGAEIYNTVDPRTYLKKVDFEMVGLDNLHTLGTRASGLMQFMQIAAPFIQQFPDLVNIPKLLKETFFLTVGNQLGDDIVKVPTSPDDLASPELENEILLQGEDVEVDDQDNHESHRASHEIALEAAKTDAAREAILTHLLHHDLKDDSRAAAEEAEQNRPPMAPTPQMAQGGPGTAPAPAGFPTDPGVAQTPPGETPGTPDSQRIPRANRQNGSMFQSENRFAGSRP